MITKPAQLATEFSIDPLSSCKRGKERKAFKGTLLSSRLQMRAGAECSFHCMLASVISVSIKGTKCNRTWRVTYSI